MINEPIRAHLLFTNKGEVAKDVKVSGGLNLSDHATVKFKILKKVNKTNRITNLDLRRTNFGLFRNLLVRIL